MKLLVCDVEGTIFKANFRLQKANMHQACCSRLQEIYQLRKKKAFLTGNGKIAENFRLK